MQCPLELRGTCEVERDVEGSFDPGCIHDWREQVTAGQALDLVGELRQRDVVAGYAPIIESAINAGVYVANDPAEFQVLVLRALREGLMGCPRHLANELSQSRLNASLGAIVSAFEATCVMGMT